MDESKRKENNRSNEEPFAGFDFSGLWDDCEYSKKEYISEYPTDEMIAKVEKELGYKLPASYIALCKLHNGGYLAKCCCPCDESTSWAEDHVGVIGILGIGSDLSLSLCGELGSRFMIEEWGYPDIGVAIADCPSAGHDMIFLDYRQCGPQGEPGVVHIDQEADYEITQLAGNFEEFIRMLVSEEEYDTTEEDKDADLEKVRTAPFSELLSILIAQVGADFDVAAQIRKVAEAIIEEKDFFALHADRLSNLLYDVQFWLYSNDTPQITREDYIEAYPNIIALANGFSTGGYAPAFVSGWLEQAEENGRIAEVNGTLSMSEAARQETIEKLRAF